MAGSSLRCEATAAAAAALVAMEALRATLVFIWSAPPAAAATRGVGVFALQSGHAPVRPSTEVGAQLLASPSSASPLPSVLVAAAAAATAVRATRSLRRRRCADVSLRATRMEWYRKVKRVGGDQALFDVTVPKPLGVKMQKFPQRKGIGISEIVPGGNTDALNRDVIINDLPGMWVLEGDRVVSINGQDCETADIEDIIKLVGESEGDSVTLGLIRNTRKGPIKVVLLPEGDIATVRRNSRLSCAAEAAKDMELTYGCIDGWCGTCWHRERSTDGIFKPCCDMLTGDWDNVMPLVLTPKPERAGDSTLLNPRGS